MNEDYLDPVYALGMPNLMDSAIAMNFLLMTKNGVRNTAIALSESTNPEVKAAMARQLEAAIDLHGEIANFMLEREWLHPYDLGEQAKLDLKSVEAAVTIGNMNLFPGDTDRLGTFATPEQPRS